MIQLPELKYQIEIQKYAEIAQIMDMLVPRINYFSDLKNHSYFFIDPKFDSEISNNLRK